MTTAKYIKKSTLEFKALNGKNPWWEDFDMAKDNGGRWNTTENTPVQNAKAMLSQKFAKLVCENEPKLAIKLKLHLFYIKK